MTFQAVRKSVKASSTVSNDTEIMLTLITESTEPLDLGKDSADTLYTITIEKEQ